jgi:hypothetical protein
MNPNAHLALTILAFLFPAAASVILAWWAWRRSKALAGDSWRLRVTYCGLIASTVGFFLESTFPIREYGFSYLPADSIPLRRVVGWAAALSWLLALLAAVLGKARWFVLAFMLTSLIGSALFIGMMDKVRDPGAAML